MIYSMTAFARQDIKGEWGAATWECRSVNHRYLELSWRLPEGLRELEPELRDLARSHVQRGKIDCNLHLSLAAAAVPGMQVNTILAKSVVQAAQQLAAATDVAADVTAEQLLRWPGVVEAKKVDFSQLKKPLLDSFQQLLQTLQNCRQREGEQLAMFLRERLTTIAEKAQLIKDHYPKVLVSFKQKLVDRFAELQLQLDPQRLEQEIVMVAQKLDVAEELDRLATHVKEMQRILDKGGVVGRRLDFLMQEFNREANTLGSKSVDSVLTQAAVDIKVLIEQMREQIQNIE